MILFVYFRTKKLMFDCFTIVLSGGAIISVEYDYRNVSIQLEGFRNEIHISGKQSD